MAAEGTSNPQPPEYLSAPQHTRTHPGNSSHFFRFSRTPLSYHLPGAGLGSGLSPQRSPEALTLLTLTMTPVDAQPLLISSTAME